MSDGEPWEALITRETIEGLYEESMKRGGMSSSAREGCVEGALGNAWTAEGYMRLDDEDETYREGLIFAGHLLFYLVKDHCYGDGNKRIGLASMQAIIGRLGLTLNASDNEIVAFVNSIADGTIKTANDAICWIAGRLVELKR